MSSEYSNYDRFDKLIDNNKKAQSWTTFWVTILCLLAAAIIFLAIANSRQKKAIADLNSSTEYKSRIIDSLKGVIQKEVDKKVDSITNYITAIDKNIQQIEKESTDPGNTSNASQAAQKENFKVVNSNIRELNERLKGIKTDLQKDRIRVFIQYSKNEDEEQVNKLISYLKRNNNYFVAPVEILSSNFNTIIKIYNYDNETEENRLRETISTIFGLPPDRVAINHLSDPKIMKPTIEIWLGSGRAAAN